MGSVARDAGKWRSEAGALWSALAEAGVTAARTGKPPSEALLFGIGGGIGLGYFVYESGDYTSLFIATRITTKETPQAGFLHTICERVGVKTTILTATSAVRIVVFTPTRSQMVCRNPAWGVSFVVMRVAMNNEV